MINNAPKTVEKALNILEVFSYTDRPVGVTELSHKLKINKSTIYRILQTLYNKRYIIKDNSTNKYILGYKILSLSGAILNRNKLREVVRSDLEDLANETLQTVRLAILDGNEVVYIDHMEGKDPIRLHLQIGSRGPLHCTAAGKSILAFLNKNELNNILIKYKFKRFTSKTITDVRRLIPHLELIKKNGYSFCNEEFTKGVRAVGAPILGIDKKVLGSIVIVAPTFRMRIKEVSIFGYKVKRYGIRISKKMGYVV